MHTRQGETGVSPTSLGRAIIGYVYVGRSGITTEELEAYILDWGLVSRGELVGIVDKVRNRMYIAKVVSIDVESPLGESAEIPEIAKGLHTELFDLIKGLIKDPYLMRRFAKLRLLFIVNLDKDGKFKYNEDGKLDTKYVDEPPMPGASVVKLSVGDYREILNLKDEKNGVCVGRLVERPDIKVCFDSGFYRSHIVVLGQTGSGKSEAITKVIEEYMRLGFTVVVMDPLGEYVDIGKSRVDGRQVYAVNVVRPGIDFTIGYNKLSPVEVKLIAQLVDEKNPPSEQGLDALADAHERYLSTCVNTNDQKKPDICLKPYFDALRSFFRSIAGTPRYKLHEKTEEAIIRRINLMERMHLWSPDPNFDLDVRPLVQGYNAVVIDYSGAGTMSTEARILANVFLSRLIDRKKIDPGFKGYPLFLVADEAAHFVPRDYDTELSRKFRELIGEMRKFHLGVALITQTPRRLHPDVLEAANTKILFRLHGSGVDEVKRYGSLSEEDLVHLTTMEDGVAFIISSYVTRNIPIMVKFDKPSVMHHYVF